MSDKVELSHFEDLEKGSSLNATPQVVDHGHHIEGNVQLVDGKGEIRLVPTPTSSGRDPLNFPKWKKVGILITCCWFSTMALAVVGGFGALLGYFFPLYLQQGITPDEIVWLATWPSLFTGIGNFIVLPLSVIIGRRPIFIGSSIMLLGASFGAARASTFQAHLIARLFLGLAGGATESLLPLIISDITFVHERAFYFGAYWCLQSLFTAMLNVASGYEAVNLSWPWYYWIFGILAFIGLVLAIFFAPETRYNRPASSIDGQITRVDEFGNLIVLTDEEAKEAIESGAINIQEDDATPEPPLTYTQSLAIWSGVSPKPFKLLANTYIRMALALLDPAIVWGLAVSSIVLAVSIAQSLSFAGILASPPYLWKPENTGLNYLGALPGGIFAMLTTGWGGDKINIWLAQRNGGVHLPEHRLPALIFPAITGLAANLMYGFCASNVDKVHWFAIVFSNNYQTYWFICSLIITTTYAVETMPRNAGPALVMVVGGKNLVSFGASYGIVPLINSGRYAYGYGILSGVMGGIMLLGIPLYYLMPRYRAWKARV